MIYYLGLSVNLNSELHIIILVKLELYTELTINRLSNVYVKIEE